MANTVVLKRSAVTGRNPTTGDLALGELALNTYDGNLFFKKDSGTASIVAVTTLDGTQTLSNKTLTSPQINTSTTLLSRGEMRFADANSSNYVGFKSPETVAANVVWTLPASDGSLNQVIKTDGSGNLSWGSASGGGGGTLVVNTRVGLTSINISGGSFTVGARSGNVSVSI